MPELDLRQERRCHLSSVLTATLKATWMVIAALAFSGYNMIADIAEEGISWNYGLLAAGGLLLLVLAVFIYNFLLWRRTYVRFEGHNLVVERRLALRQSRTTLRPETVASINLQQNILERMFATFRLQFDINSSATADKTDFDLVFSQEVALAIKARLEQAGGEPAAAEMAVDGSSDFGVIRRFRFGAVLRHALLGTPLWSVIYTLISVPLLLWGLLDDISGFSGRTLVSMIVALWPLVVQTIGPLFRYYGFTLARRGNDVIVSCGLLTKRQYTLPLDKTNAIVLSQPFMARAFGMGYGEIINVGMGDVQDGIAPAFCLITDEREVQALLYQVAPQFSVLRPPTPSPRPALAVHLLRWGLFGLAGLAAGIIVGYWWAGAIFLLLLLTSGWAAWRTKAIDLMEDKLAVTSGVFGKRTFITFYSRLQDLLRLNGPLARKLGLAYGCVTILSDSTHRVNNIGYFPLATFDQISQAMLSFDSNGNERQPSLEPENRA